MRTLSLLFLFITLTTISYAQSYAVVNDSDGYTNIRKEGNSKSAVIGKIYNGNIFYCDEDYTTVKKSDWIKIYQMNEYGSLLEGYIHYSRILQLSSFKSIANSKTVGNQVSIKNDSLTIKVTSAKFIAKNHTLSYHKPATNNEAGYYDKIDGKKIWGTDGELPRTAITGLSIIFNGFSLSVPKSALSNLFEPNFNTLRVYFGTANTFYIRMNNSDGAGGYTVIWIIKNGKYLTRYLDNSEA